MKTNIIQKWLLTLFACMMLFGVGITAFADNSTTGGTQSGHTSDPSVGDGTTDVWAGVTVDYMFPLRYVVTNTSGDSIASASIEHFDKSENGYVFIGKTNEKGIWETKVTPDFWMNGVLQQSGQAGVVYSDDNVFNIHHRVSAQGYITKEEVAKASIEMIDGETVGIVYVVLERVPEQTNGKGPENVKPVSVQNSLLPKTGVQSYWGPLGTGSLLMLVAAILVAKLLYDERKNSKDRKNSEDIENSKDRGNTNS